jgi:hypothetical protein
LLVGEVLHHIIAEKFDDFRDTVSIGTVKQHLYPFEKLLVLLVDDRDAYLKRP